LIYFCDIVERNLQHNHERSFVSGRDIQNLKAAIRGLHESFNYLIAVLEQAASNQERFDTSILN